MNRFIKIGLLLFVLLVALGLRLRAVELLPIDYDEDDYLLAGQHYSRAILAHDWREIIDYDFNIEHPALVKLTYGLVLSRLPQRVEVPQKPSTAPPADVLPQPQLNVLRWTSVVFGSLEVLLLAMLNPLAGLFLAVHTMTIKYTSQVYLEALPALTSLLAVMAYVRSKRSPRPGLWLVLSGAALGLTAASKYIYAVVGIAILVHWLFVSPRESDERSAGQGWLKSWHLILGWGILSLLVFLLANPILWPDPLGRLRESLLFNVDYSQSNHVQGINFPFWQPLATLFQSAPWHPGVFLIAMDALIALLGLAGLRRLWRRHSVFALWLVVGLIFLLIWPTKWPQYILVITAPFSLAAAEGFRGIIWEPLVGWGRGFWTARLSGEKFLSTPDRERPSLKETLNSIPWLLPGLLVLGTIALFPLIYQVAIALTDFRAVAIRDGLTGGVWREVWLGLTGQVGPVDISALSQTLSRDREVHYAGFSVLKELVSGLGVGILIFEVLWTFLSVGAQLALGLGVALLLDRRGILLKRLWLVIFILPWAIPEFIGVLIWQRMFEPRFGWLVLALDYPQISNYPFGPQLASWQENPSLALGVLLVAATWYGFPLMLVAATAALRMLPREVYDAAAMDGASGWDRFRWITWPMIFPLLIPAIIVRSIFAFNQFYLFYVLQPPYPVITLATLSFFTFDVSGQFRGFFALSAAINLVTVILLIIFVAWFNRWSKAAAGVTYA